MIRMIWGRILKSVLLFLAWLFCFPATVGAQQANFSVQLKAQKFPFEPTEFYINKVLDSRDDRTSIGLFVVPGPSGQLPKQPGNFNETADYAIEKFLKESLRRQTNLRPVNIRLQKLKVLEKVLTGALVSGSVEISLSFESDGEVPVRLLEYSGGTEYTRPANQISVIDQALGATIIHSINYFNNWINKEAGSNENFAKEVVLVFEDYEPRDPSDTVFYSVQRRLTWMDFKSPPNNNSPFVAEIFPFLSFDQSSDIVNGVINIRIIPKVYFIKSFSWVKGSSRNPYTLNHEQRHFDIVKIAEQRFKKKLIAEKLTVENYQGILSVEYLQILREMNAMQKEYDLDTKHGTDTAMQDKWNKRIDTELKSYFISGAHSQ
ncbi:hypothetical protein GZH53_02685 [Flavihumibacter sp. R14]|nr:hypothetical protein [Flavihumibacter soli]